MKGREVSYILLVCNAPSLLSLYVHVNTTPDWTDYYRLVLPYRTFYMIATTEAEAEDWLTFLRWRLVSQLLRNL